MRLRFPGPCLACGEALAKGTRAWWEPSRKSVTCEPCWERLADAGRTTWSPPIGPAAAPPVRTIDQRERGTAGLKASQQFERRSSGAAGDDPLPAHVVAWSKGARGERHTAEVLREHVASPAVLLHDVRIPRSRSNIDHIVIAPNGVWILDTKALAGCIEVRERHVAGAALPERTVLVNGRPRRKLTEGLVWQYEFVRSVIEPIEPDACVTCALVFSPPEGAEQSSVSPFEADGVLCATAAFLARCINRPADPAHPLDWLAIERLAGHFRVSEHRAS